MIPTDDSRLSLLAQQSIDVILANQAPSGAYLASPAFPVYRFSWLRDGAFIADAMSRVGQVASAEAFLAWCAGILVAREGRVDTLIARARRGEVVPANDHLHTRYTIDGDETDDAWWNYQLDGYGAWLWALGAHHARHGRPVATFLPGALISARYIDAFWADPSYDWWEEHPTERHVSTLAAVAAGLAAVAGLPGVDRAVADGFAATARTIRSRIGEEVDRLGYLPKWLGGDAVDASLLSVGAAFDILDPGDPVMLATVDRIEADLVHDGGVHRYLDDTYYGGAEWLLLAGFLGLQHLASGQREAAARQLAWIADHAGPSGTMPEQVTDHVLAPDRVAEWLERWGPIADPLLWSHAMYLSLAVGLGVLIPERVTAL